MRYITAREKLNLLIIALLAYNTVVLAVIITHELGSRQQAIDNLAICQDTLPPEEWHLCFDWAQAMTDWDVGPSLAFGGNVIIYALFRTWNTGQHDNQVKRLMGQAYRISYRKVNSPVPVIMDDGWAGILTYECRNLYDDYAVAVTKYNKNDLTVKELQKYAKKLFDKLSKEYSRLEKEATGKSLGS